MAEAENRICDPISRKELERRWKEVRALMPSLRLDALVVQGMSNQAGTAGYFRWFTGVSPFSSYAQTIVFPREGLMTMIAHGAINGMSELDGNNPTVPGVGLQLFTPDFPAVAYCDGYQAELAARDITKRGYRRVGIVAANNMYYGFGAKLKELLGNVEFVDGTDLVDEIKSIKSPEEIDLIRRAGAMQDEIFERTRAHVKPGMKEFEVSAYSHYVGQLLGSPTGYFLCGAAPVGKPVPYRLINQQARRIREGDVMIWKAENTGPGGMFVHIGRMFVFGKAPQELVDVHGKIVEAQDFTVRLLETGGPLPDLYAEYQAYMVKHGMPEERRVHCHGQGYDVVERPLMRHDETMKLATNMNIGIHPAFGDSRMTATISDNYLLGENGAEAIHKTARRLFEL
jgi:Xaa-Pro aminopeptidase